MNWIVKLSQHELNTRGNGVSVGVGVWVVVVVGVVVLVGVGLGVGQIPKLSVTHWLQSVCCFNTLK